MASLRSSECRVTMMNGLIRAASPADISNPIRERRDGCWGSTHTLGLAEAGCEADSLFGRVVPLSRLFQTQLPHHSSDRKEASMLDQ